MKKHGFIVLLLLLCSPAAFSQNAAASKSWTAFWEKFKTAVYHKDSTAMRKMMADDFDDGGGGGTASQWLQSMHENNSWTWYRTVVDKGTKAGKCKIPCRSTLDGYLLFENRKGTWLWVGLGGEGGD
jgi:hypothetical protein